MAEQHASEFELLADATTRVMRRLLLTKGQQQQIAARREAGESAGDLARAFGCSRSNISATCLKLGVDRSDGKFQASVAPVPLRIERNGVVVRRFTPDEDARLLAMAGENLSRAAIGKALGRHRHSIRYRLMTLARHEARREAAGAAPPFLSPSTPTAPARHSGDC
ncbi:helix-turn-helix domain-containing protein [Methylobacterium sp.]|uniref:helix-turn-helix domain-containing protein n=1 Tax=Methylobacterium sp. TaxID=409 RepID=UPI0025F0A62A|nr:helix-turn-helix domain-containing protein [Methylobacterium sp.]MBY0259571.1 hypothetical protein [Methylobacterium sp.]